MDIDVLEKRVMQLSALLPHVDALVALVAPVSSDVVGESDPASIAVDAAVEESVADAPVADAPVIEAAPEAPVVEEPKTEEPAPAE